MHLSIRAFLLTEARAAAVHEASAMPRLRRCHTQVNEGDIAAACAALGREESPDVLILEAAGTAEALVAELDSLADVVRPGTRVILLGDHNDIALYRRLLAMGISEYLYGQVGAAEVQDCIMRAVTGGEDRPTGRLVAVYGATGGAGASTVAVNLADVLSAREDESVALVDLDLWFGTDAMALNIQPRQTAGAALGDASRIDEVLVDRSLEKASDSLMLLGGDAAPDRAVAPDEEALDRLLEVLRGKADIVVVDLPRLWAPWVKTVLTEAAEAIIVCYPDLVNLRNARAVLDLLKTGRGADTPARLVFNRVGQCRKTELAAADFREGLGQEPVLALPFDPVSCGTAMNNGQTLRQTAASSPLTRAVEELSRVVVPEPGAARRKKQKLDLKSLFTRKR